MWKLLAEVIEPETEDRSRTAPAPAPGCWETSVPQDQLDLYRCSTQFVPVNPTFYRHSITIPHFVFRYLCLSFSFQPLLLPILLFLSLLISNIFSGVQATVDYPCSLNLKACDRNDMLYIFCIFEEKKYTIILLLLLKHFAKTIIFDQGRLIFMDLYLGRRKKRFVWTVQRRLR